MKNVNNLLAALDILHTHVKSAYMATIHNITLTRPLTGLFAYYVYIMYIALLSNKTTVMKNKKHEIRDKIDNYLDCITEEYGIIGLQAVEEYIQREYGHEITGKYDVVKSAAL